MENVLRGQCFCGQVKYEVENNFKDFYLCHCKQCQRLTGSAFASNIITDPDNIKWLEGREKITEYEHRSRVFSKSFCSSCGSGVPYINKSGDALVVPAGSLTDDPNIMPKANIFSTEKACWLNEGLQAEAFDGFAS